jgi:Ca-activated chloride channel family protein
VARNTANTRIFTFGVGDDVNAAMLDRLAEQTKAVSTYVRPEEDIEVKVSALYAKISHPVLTDLKLAVGNDVKLTEMYPNHLPDLFHGNQLVVLARYKGQGHAVVTLTGKVGEQTREFVYEVEFPGHTKNDKAFVECLWARRKVGYLLDQIRQNGEQKELVEEVVKLAKKHGITTPYTSYLVVPDGAQPPVANNQPVTPATTYPASQGYYINHMTINNSTMPQSGTAPSGGKAGGYTQYAPSFAAPASVPPTHPVSAGAPALAAPAPVGQALGTTSQGANAVAAASKSPAGEAPREHFRRGLNAADDEGAAREAEEESDVQAMTEVRQEMANGQQGAQTGKLGVDYALRLQALRSQDRLSKTLTRQAAGRTCVAIRGAWIDQDFDAKMTLVKVKAMSAAYFRLLEKHPELKEVFQMGNRIIWVTPSGTALVISAVGEEKMDDDAIARLFVAKK